MIRQNRSNVNRFRSVLQNISLPVVVVVVEDEKYSPK